jgi:hypothetical protein
MFHKICEASLLSRSEAILGVGVAPSGKTQQCSLLQNTADLGDDLQQIAVASRDQTSNKQPKKICGARRFNY